MRTPRPRKDKSTQELQAVQVFCRIKPNDTGLPCCMEVVDENTLKTFGTRAGAHKETLHTFTAVYDEDVPQNVVFENVALPLISELFDGKNGLLLTYGTTGSGKTYAMQGNSKENGILPLALDVIFNSLGSRQTKKYVVKPDGVNGFNIQSESDAIMDRHRLDYQQRLRLPRADVPLASAAKSRTSVVVDVPPKALYAVFISLVEVYNNNIFDLLSESSDLNGKAPTTHVLREDAQRNIYVSGCVEVEVKSVEDALRIFSTGQKRRHVGQTALNSESSRSHCIFTIRLVRTGYDEKYDEAIEDKNLLVTSQLCLVDLAGSERATRAGTQGDRLREASRSPAPSHLRPHYMQPIRNSGRSADSADTTVSLLNSEDQMNSLLVELNNYGTEIEQCLSRLLNDNYGLEPDIDLTNVSQLIKHLQSTESDHYSDDFDQDSAPEQDRHQKTAVFNRAPHLWKVDLEPLRALVTHRMECRQRAHSALERDLTAFRTYLVDFTNIESPQPNMQPGGSDLSERTKLEARIRKLEGQVLEHASAAKRERSDRLRQVEEYRLEIERLRTELGRLPSDPSLSTHKNSGGNRLRPSLSHTWENRLAERQDGNQVIKPDSRGRQPITSSVNRRVAPFNPRHRRSRSVGGDGSRWLEHQESSSAPLGTVLTPKLKNRKSVTRLELKDTLKASNYLLHHQEATPDGSVETKLYKLTFTYFENPHFSLFRHSTTQDSTPASEGNSQRSPGHHGRRRSEKRRHSSVQRQQSSLSSTTTNTSDESVKTTSSSNYRPISPPGPAPILGNHLGSDVIRDRCNVGFSSTGGIGRNTPFGGPTLRKHSTTQDSTPASEGNSQRSPGHHGRRRSEKRRHSSVQRQQSSLSSTTTNTSDESVKTTSSSNYRPISPPGPAPILGNHLGSDVIRDRCNVGFSSTGGIGRNTPFGGPTLRK
ncbi:kinesin family member 23 [Paragonimus westermani]|uniref:Kinesin-like protein n=1 Tax=Paragonimus westermani TaxID=34504 RepID=A0A5J4NTX8_9TREM|nr:kinesin family member 23 [Paragonimus westermani]